MQDGITISQNISVVQHQYVGSSILLRGGNRTNEGILSRENIQIKLHNGMLFPLLIVVLQYTIIQKLEIRQIPVKKMRNFMSPLSVMREKHLLVLAKVIANKPLVWILLLGDFIMREKHGKFGRSNEVDAELALVACLVVRPYLVVYKGTAGDGRHGVKYTKQDLGIVEIARKEIVDLVVFLGQNHEKISGEHEIKEKLWRKVTEVTEERVIEKPTFDPLPRPNRNRATFDQTVRSVYDFRLSRLGSKIRNGVTSGKDRSRLILTICLTQFSGFRTSILKPDTDRSFSHSRFSSELFSFFCAWVGIDIEFSNQEL